MSYLILGIILVVVGILLRALVQEALVRTLGYILLVVGIILIAVGLIYLIAGAGSIDLAILPNTIYTTLAQ